jgi:nucleotide-binding universal stress UspA family protein
MYIVKSFLQDIENINMESKIVNILFPINFSSVSLNALNTAIRLAKGFDANLHLVETSNNISSIQSSLRNVNERNKSTECDKIKFNKLNTLGNILTNTHDINCIVKSLNRAIPVGIVEYASLNEIDLIIMSTKRTSKWRRLLFRSNLQNIVNQSICPSLVIPENTSSVLFNKILFPIRFHGGALIKYHFLKKFLSLDKPCIRLLILSKNFSDLADKQLQKIVNAVNEVLERDAVEVSGSVHTDEMFSKAVIQMSKSMGADLIVITGDSDITQHKRFSNRYQRDILDRSDVPVLNIKINSFQNTANQ